MYEKSILSGLFVTVKRFFITFFILVSAPQPEAAIESSECRVRLLQHIERTQLLLEARLDSIEAQIAGMI